MKLAIIMSFKSFQSKDGKQTYLTCELSTGQTVFLSEDHGFEIGDTVLVSTNKYKKEGVWKSSSSIVKVKIGQ